MKKRILILLSFVLPVCAGAHDLNGIWISKDPDKPQRELKIDIKIDESTLLINECRTDEEGFQFCAKRNWNLQGDGEIWENNKKIGDVFPFAVLIFNSHSQMSDLIKIKLITRNQIEYQTVYTNIDGEVDYVWARPFRQVE